MKLVTLSLILSLSLLVSCATPLGYTEKPVSRYDRTTSYRVDDTADGFTLTMYYARYQFFPESDALLASAKSNMLALCHEVAASKGRRIHQVNEQTIKMSMGRNGLSGITSWTGTVRAYYQ